MAEQLTELWSDDQACLPPQAHTGVGTRLEVALESLPAPLRTALILRYQEELTPAEIAALLDLPLATVKSNLQRALALLRRKAHTLLKEYVRA